MDHDAYLAAVLSLHGLPSLIVVFLGLGLVFHLLIIGVLFFLFVTGGPTVQVAVFCFLLSLDLFLFGGSAQAFPKPGTAAATDAAKEAFNDIPQVAQENHEKYSDNGHIRHQGGNLFVLDEAIVLFGLRLLIIGIIHRLRQLPA